MNFLLILLVSALFQFFAPWWVIAIVPFVISLWRPTSSPHSFWIGFLAIALLWLAYGFYLHFVSGGAMSDRIAEIFSLKKGILLLIVTAIVGGLVGGMSGLSGYLARKMA
ncbi:hypothetical protein [Dyadobacter bucti]|jgi:hypothetical protein|uniref:hypothetical protein n=1 Tax=Dyadobacter bucti TaxID=2572203 RepID=UPI0011081C68|nr:hypothetical protein [Dyadobacter bucti]